MESFVTFIRRMSYNYVYQFKNDLCGSSYYVSSNKADLKIFQCFLDARLSVFIIHFIQPDFHEKLINHLHSSTIHFLGKNKLCVSNTNSSYTAFNCLEYVEFIYTTFEQFIICKHYQENAKTHADQIYTLKY